MTTGRINQVTTRHSAGGSAAPHHRSQEREWQQGSDRAADVKNETADERHRNVAR